MQKWEYKTVFRSREWQSTMLGTMQKMGDWNPQVDAFLPELGENGWELVTVTGRSAEFGEGRAGLTTQEVWVFKRPKP